MGLGSHSVLGSVGDRALASQSRVPATDVVPSLDVFEEGLSGLGLGAEAAAMDQFTLKRGKERLRHGVVVGITDRADGALHAQRRTAIAERRRGICLNQLSAKLRNRHEQPAFTAAASKRSLRMLSGVPIAVQRLPTPAKASNKRSAYAGSMNR